MDLLSKARDALRLIARILDHPLDDPTRQSTRDLAREMSNDIERFQKQMAERANDNGKRET